MDQIVFILHVHEWVVTIVTFDALCELDHSVDSVGCDYYNHNHS